MTSSDSRTDPVGRPCEIAPCVGGLVYDRNTERCWHEGGLWHDLPLDSRTDRDHDDVTEMRWHPDWLMMNEHGQSMYGPEAIVAWVNANGGEARYEPGFRNALQARPARIAVRQADGLWAYAAPGDTIVKGEEWFKVLVPASEGREYNRSIREFTVRRSS